MPSFSSQLAGLRERCGVPVHIAPQPGTEMSQVPFMASELTPGEVMSVYNASMDESILNLYGISTYNLKSLMRFGTFYRVIVMLSETIAGILTAPGLCVIDQDNNKVDNLRARRALHIIKKRPSPGVKAPIFWSDVTAEMLVSGNTLMQHLYEDRLKKAVVGFELASTDGSRCDRYTRTNVPLIYSLGFIGESAAEQIPANEVSHARFPVLSQTGSNKPGFAPSPVVAVVAATEVGRELDKRLKRWASDNRGNMHINLKAPPGMTQIKQPADVIAKLKPILKSLDSRQPILTENADIRVLEDRVMEKGTVELQEHNTEDILRVYGVPAPMGGVQLTSWGSGIESLIRLYFNSALKPNLDRIFPCLEDALLPTGQRLLPDMVDVFRSDATGIHTLIQALSGNQNGPPYAVVNEIRHIANLPNGGAELEAEREAWHERQSSQSGSNDGGDETSGGDDPSGIEMPPGFPGS